MTVDPHEKSRRKVKTHKERGMFCEDYNSRIL